MSKLSPLPPTAEEAAADSINQVFTAFYGELRNIARARLFQAGQPTVLDTSGLIHESYLRFLKTGAINVTDRPRFLAYAAKVMRSIIVDAVRDRQVAARGGGAQYVTLDSGIAQPPAEADEEVLNVHKALDELAAIEPRIAQVVEMRYFGGLTEAEIASLLQVSVRTVERDWEKARLFLYRALRQQSLEP